MNLIEFKIIILIKFLIKFKIKKLVLTNKLFKLNTIV